MPFNPYDYGIRLERPETRISDRGIRLMPEATALSDRGIQLMQRPEEDLRVSSLLPRPEVAEQPERIPEKPTSVISLYRQMLSEPEPEIPQLVEGGGPGAYRYRGKVHAPSRTDRLIGTAIAAFAGPLLGPQATREIADEIFYGPYERTLRQSQLERQGYSGRLQRMAQLARLEEAQQKLIQPQYEQVGNRLLRIPAPGMPGQPEIAYESPAPDRFIETKRGIVRLPRPGESGGALVYEEPAAPEKAQTETPEMKNYKFYAAEEKAAGRIPKGFEQWRLTPKPSAGGTRGLDNETRMLQEESRIEARYAQFLNQLLLRAANPMTPMSDVEVTQQIESLNNRMEEDIRRNRERWMGNEGTQEAPQKKQPIRLKMPWGVVEIP